MSRASKWKPQVCTEVHTCTYLTRVFLSAYVSIKVHLPVSIFGSGGNDFNFWFGPHSSSEKLVSLILCKLSLEQLKSWRVAVFVEENSIETMQYLFHSCTFDQIGQIFLRGDEISEIWTVILCLVNPDRIWFHLLRNKWTEDIQSLFFCLLLIHNFMSSVIQNMFLHEKHCLNMRLNTLH